MSHDIRNFKIFIYNFSHKKSPTKFDSSSYLVFLLLIKSKNLLFLFEDEKITGTGL